MPTQSGLEAFTLYLDPEDPEDVPLIRYLKTKLKKKKVSSELRNAMLMYIEYLKGGSLVPQSRPVRMSLPPFEPPQIEPPAEVEEEPPVAKSVQNARNTFMKRR